MALAVAQNHSQYNINILHCGQCIISYNALAAVSAMATTMRLLVSHQLLIESHMRAGGLSHYF